ncbi:MAG: hypothetical protein ACP5DZ_01415 [Bacteroidales bacterium]
MKTNLIFLSLIIAILSIGFLSCEKESDILFYDDNIGEDVYLKTTSQIKPEDFYYVGEIHNEGLEYIYNGFKEVCLDSIGVMLDGVKDLTEMYFIQKVGIDDKTVTYFCDSSFLDYVYFYNETDFKCYWEYSISKIDFTVDAQKYLITNLFRDAADSDNPEELSKLIDEYNNQAERTIFDTIALKEFYMCTTVLEYSSKYWYANLDKWNEIFQTKASEGWFNWNRVARTDAAGFVGGAIVGGAGAIGTGVGAPAALGIAARVGSIAAVSGSSADATVQLWDHWFGKP